MPHRSTTDPVQAELEAYNARDIDDFMRWWAPDCEYYLFPDVLVARGLQEVRERHLERFAELDLNGVLLHRSVVGSMVVDHELVQRTFPEGPGHVEVLCVYEVQDGLIRKAWFSVGERTLHPVG